MPFTRISLPTGNPAEEHFKASLAVRPEDVMVANANSTFEDWSFASAAAPVAQEGNR
jgi:hypothetical protein